MSTVPENAESSLELATTELFGTLGYSTANLFHESFGPNSSHGRETPTEVVLKPRLASSLAKLNPALPAIAITNAIDELTRDRSAQSLVNANRDLHQFLKNGVPVSFQDDKGTLKTEKVRVIDWATPRSNDFFLASQFRVTGDLYKRRADLVGFVNGLPLLFIELKASHKQIELAFKHNFCDYRTTIPQLFWYNAIVILSNGSDSRIGSLTADWDHFFDWKKVASEDEKGVVSLETMIRGTCEPAHLLDLVENFTLFSEVRGGVVKLVAQNHQYLGVRNALAAVNQIASNRGRLGVFWHTQGSGKSYSMVFFCQSIIRRIPGNWTFVIITDRQELDDQIYKTFAGTGIVKEKQAQATSGDHLRQLLSEDHRFVFTLIQKFRTERGQRFPELSKRSDVIVITDEAHRSQYDTFALNMRAALPNAAFIGFTGTPLIAGEEKTRDVFGEYVSIYDFKQSIDDGATVPLFYENRIPELQLTNANLNEDMAALLEEADLDEDQEKKLEREFGREYHLITRDERLATIAGDLVEHFLNRGHMGKAMVVSIDRFTAVKTYDKVREHWKRHIQELRAKVNSTEGEEQAAFQKRLLYLEATDMAVVISGGQNEEAAFKAKGLDIRPHRQRLVKEDLESKFKDPADPFRLVFVCAMWMTGFDVPSCSTIYLDKPMRNHTLMQTIARANRVFPEKNNGLIVDYVGIFRSLQKALAIYGVGGGGDMPVKDKKELVSQLRKSIKQVRDFCKKLGADLGKTEKASGFVRIQHRDEAVEAILVTAATKKEFLSRANLVERLYKAVLPDQAGQEFAPTRGVVFSIAERIRALGPEVDISEVMGAVEKLLDSSVATEGYIIRPSRDQAVHEGNDGLIDLSQIDFLALQKLFEKPNPRTMVERLKAQIGQKVAAMVLLNRTRINFLERFQALIAEYNSGSLNIEHFVAKLTIYTQELSEEDKRGIAEKLSEEELAVFDLLTKPGIPLSSKEKGEVKRVAKDLLKTLKAEKLVLDWRKKQASRAAVRLCVEQMLDQLPRVFTPPLWEKKCDAVYQHVFDSYMGPGQSVYGRPLAQR